MVREFLGALRTPDSEAIIVTLCGYTSERALRRPRLEIVTEEGLAKLLADARVEHSPEDSGPALHERPKVCPKCESEMLLRTAGRAAVPVPSLGNARPIHGCRVHHASAPKGNVPLTDRLVEPMAAFLSQRPSLISSTMG